jgi:hypothetical protein
MYSSGSTTRFSGALEYSAVDPSVSRGDSQRGVEQNGLFSFLASRVFRSVLRRRQLFLLWTLAVLLGLGALLLGLVLSKHKRQGSALTVFLLIALGSSSISISVYKLAEHLGLVGTQSIEEATYSRRTPAADDYDSSLEPS